MKAGDKDKLLYSLDSLDTKYLAKKEVKDLQKFLSNDSLYYILWEYKLNKFFY